MEVEDFVKELRRPEGRARLSREAVEICPYLNQDDMMKSISYVAPALIIILAGD